jgi:hypothetical protein
MAKDFSGMVVAMLLIGLYVVSTIVFGIQIAEDNNSESTLLQDSTINKTLVDLNSKLGEQKDLAQSLREAFESEDPIKVLVFLFSSIIGAVKQTMSSFIGIGNIIFSFFAEVLGIGEGAAVIILNTFLAIMILTMLFLGWKILKVGQ